MQQFVNKFNIAMNQDKSEVIVNFFQSAPIVPDGGEELQVHNDLNVNIFPVANLVMTNQSAKLFAKTLSDMLSKE